MTPFVVEPGVAPGWPGITPAGRVVAEFLARVRVTGDADAAAELMAPVVQAHQQVAEDPQTVARTPQEYAEHVRDMLREFGPFRYEVVEALGQDDRVYIRWRQHGHDLERDDGAPGTGAPVTELGSVVFRVANGRIAEYWIQLDRLGMTRQLGGARGAD
jgi:predicted ester cyclase